MLSTVFLNVLIKSKLPIIKIKLTLKKKKIAEVINITLKLK